MTKVIEIERFKLIVSKSGYTVLSAIKVKGDMTTPDETVESKFATPDGNGQRLVERIEKLNKSDVVIVEFQKYKEE